MSDPNPFACPNECDRGMITVRANDAGTMTRDIDCPTCKGRGLLDELQCELCPHICTVEDPPVLTDDGWVCSTCAKDEAPKS